MRNFFNIIILLGALQGLIIGALLFFKKGGTHANRILAILILIISMACFNIYLMEIGARYSYSFWAAIEVYIPFIIAMPIGPLIFFNTKANLNSTFRISSTDRIHFYPLILDLIPNITFILFAIGLLMGFLSEEDRTNWRYFADEYNTYIDIPRWISISIYVLLAKREIDLITLNSNEIKKSLRWPKRFVFVFLMFQLIWLLHLIPYVIPGVSDSLLKLVGWYPIYIPLAVMVYWLGINGYLVSQAKSRETSASKPLALSDDVVNQTKNILRQAMEEDKLFLDPLFNLTALVHHTGIQQKIISSVLNQHLGKSFNDFVNEYRVNEVKKKLVKSDYNHLTITGIAMECGFNSQATFQRTFKHIVGQSPREFQSEHLASTQKMPTKTAQI
ncbi:MAG: helix-turn-helix transcriptional regulator [Chryseolinea sp.]